MNKTRKLKSLFNNLLTGINRKVALDYYLRIHHSINDDNDNYEAVKMLENYFLKSIRDKDIEKIKFGIYDLGLLETPSGHMYLKYDAIYEALKTNDIEIVDLISTQKYAATPQELIEYIESIIKYIHENMKLGDPYDA